MNAGFSIEHGDCLSVMMAMTENSVDAIITDPPYGLSREPDPVKVMSAWVSGESFQHNASGFMGHKWDAFVPQPEYWKEVLRVLKPGGYGLIFAGSRTQDWMTMSLRFAGFEIVDTIMWVYSQGFPKSHNISKAIDKKLSAIRTKVSGIRNNTYDGCNRDPSRHGNPADQSNIGEWGLKKTPHGIVDMFPATPEATQWDGWGTQLKPAYEPILLVRRPLDGTFANNVLAHGVGGINIDACRIHAEDAPERSYTTKRYTTGHAIRKNGKWKTDEMFSGVKKAGRWPANFAHDGSDQVMNAFSFPDGGDGSAARFFYCAKPSGKERHLGMGVSPKPDSKHGATLRQIENGLQNVDAAAGNGNTHPTVKPIKLMSYLCKLICPPGGLVLDPFCGSGTTGMAAIENGFSFAGIEKDLRYASIAKARCAYAYQRMSGNVSAREIKKRVGRVAGRYKKGEQLQMFT